MIDLREYVVGGKPANTEEFLLGKTAMKKVDEDCYILVIPQSVWDELKKETKECDHRKLNATSNG